MRDILTICFNNRAAAARSSEAELSQAKNRKNIFEPGFEPGGRFPEGLPGFRIIMGE
jgi:hypothetical protein